MKVLILTSCCIPNTDFSVSAITPKQRFDDLLRNVEYLAQHSFYDLLVIADPSLHGHNDLSKELSQQLCLYLDTLPWLTSEVYSPNFTSNEHHQIRVRGKGLSELLILLKSVKHLHEQNCFPSTIFKISGRYCLANLPYLADICTKYHQNQNIHICINLSHRHHSATTIYFSFSPAFLPTLQSFVAKVNEPQGFILESIMFTELTQINSSFTKTLPPLLIKPGLSSGSTMRKQRIRTQLASYILYYISRIKNLVF